VGVHVYVGDDAVNVTFNGIDRIITLCPRGLRLDMADVTAARVAPATELRVGLGIRVGGGYYPGRLATGWFTVKAAKSKRQLWCVHRDPELLAIETRLDRPCRVVLQTPDRHDIAWYIGERLARR
jgi:hypothetical protein